MGGPKKPSLSQLEKRGRRPAEKGTGGAREKTVSSIIPPPVEELLGFIKGQQYVTPFIIAEKFGIRISVAKKVLSSLAEKNYLRLVSGDSRLKIYEPVKEALKEVKPKEKKGKKKS